MNSPGLESIVKLFEICCYKHDLYSVSGDWCECAAIAMSNAVDLTNFEKCEARYLDVVRRYDRETIGNYSRIMAEVVMAMEEEPQDILGATFHTSGLHSGRGASSSRPILSAKCWRGSWSKAERTCNK